MSDELQLPRAARVFVSFAALLRVNGFAVAPEQTTAFLAAIELLGPRSMEAIRLAGLATLAPPPERRATYDRLFDLHFLGSEAVDQAGAEDDEVVRLQEEGRGQDVPRRWSSDTLRSARPAMPCENCHARPLPACRGGAAIAACAPVAARGPICAALCAKACATMARCCGSDG